MSRPRTIAKFYKLDTFGEGIDEARIKGYNGENVVFDLHDSWGNVWYDRALPERTFLDRYFYPTREHSLWG